MQLNSPSFCSSSLRVNHGPAAICAPVLRAESWASSTSYSLHYALIWLSEVAEKLNYLSPASLTLSFAEAHIKQRLVLNIFPQSFHADHNSATRHRIQRVRCCLAQKRNSFHLICPTRSQLLSALSSAALSTGPELMEHTSSSKLFTSCEWRFQAAEREFSASCTAFLHMSWCW